MKKILILTTLLCLILTNTTIAKAAQPLQLGAVSWSAAPDGAKNIYPIFWLTRDNTIDRDIFTAVRLTGEAFANIPKGYRAVMLSPMWSELNFIIRENEQNYIWADFGVQKLRGIMEQYFSTCSRAEVGIDIFVGDYQGNFDAQGLGFGDQNIEKYDKIWKDNRFATDVSPILDKLGWVYPSDPKTNPLYYVCYPEKAPIDGQHLNRARWDAFADYKKRQYLNQCIFEPLKKYFPSAIYSDYGHNEIDAKYKYTDNEGIDRYEFGNLSDLSPYPNAGTHAAPVLYKMLKDIKKSPPAAYPYSDYAYTHLNSLKFSTQKLLATYLSSGAFQYWLGYYGFASEGGSSNYLGLTDYFNEMVFHSYLLGGSVPLYFAPVMKGGADQPDFEKLQAILEELNGLIGYSDNVPLIKNISEQDFDARWEKRYVLNGIESNGQKVYRLTLDDSIPNISLKSILVSSSPVKFKIANEIIEFPAGYKIVTPEKATSTKVGYWIVGKGDAPKEYKDKSPAALPPGDQPIPTLEKSGMFFASVNKNPLPNPKKKFSFADMAGNPAAQAVQTLYKLGVVKGDEKGNFNPKNELTRVELLAMLTRLLKLPEKEYNGMFDDVSSNNWFAGIVQCSFDNNISKGVSEKIFDPYSKVNREQITTFLIRAYKKPLPNEKSPLYSDDNQISIWARDGVYACKTLGITKIWDVQSNFMPKNNVTREEAAQLMYELYKIMG